MRVVLQGQGQRMGGGKGSIDHYVTPIRSGRIIIEVAGHCEYLEVFLCFFQLCERLEGNTVVDRKPVFNI